MQPRFRVFEEAKHLETVSRWAEVTRTGDRAEITGGAGLPRVLEGYLGAQRELHRQGVPGVRPLLRDDAAPAGGGERHRHRQSSPALRGPDGARGLLWRGHPRLRPPHPRRGPPDRGRGDASTSASRSAALASTSSRAMSRPRGARTPPGVTSRTPSSRCAACAMLRSTCSSPIAPKTSAIGSSRVPRARRRSAPVRRSTRS